MCIRDRYKIIPLNEISDLLQLVPYLFWLVFLLTFVNNCMMVSTTKLETLFTLSAVLLSPVPMYFSPTIYASGARSYFIPAVLTIFLLGRLIKKHQLNSTKYLLPVAIYPMFIAMYLIFWMISGLYQPHSFQ